MLFENHLQQALFLSKHYFFLVNQCSTICLLSPEPGEVSLINSLFNPDNKNRRGSKTSTKIKTLTKLHWNLNNPGQEHFDLIWACNVLQCVEDAQTALNNILKSCKFFVFQDLICRKRGVDKELRDEGDRRRFRFREYGQDLEHFFNLNQYERFVLDFQTYQDRQSIAFCQHFMCLMQGHL